MTRHGWAECTWTKACIGIPILLNLALISYISYSFHYFWIPSYFKNDENKMLKIFLQCLFSYFSLMTYIHLAVTLVMDPGYLPEWLKAPLKQDKKAPMELVRIYNIRLWKANKIKDFESFFEDVESQFSAPAVVAAKDDGEEVKTEGNNTVSTLASSIDDTRLINGSISNEAEAIEMTPLSKGGSGTSIEDQTKHIDLNNLNTEKYYKVDVNNLSPLEQRAYNLTEE